MKNTTENRDLLSYAQLAKKRPAPKPSEIKKRKNNKKK